MRSAANGSESLRNERGFIGENAESGKLPEGPESAKNAAPASLSALVDGWVKFGAAIYVVGFAVMLVQTSRLNVPAMEVLHFQTILAGLPIWLVLFSGYWLSEKLVRRMVGEANDLGDWRVSLGAALVIAGAAGILYVELHTLFELQLTLSNSVIVVSAIVFVVSLIFVVIAFQKDYSNIRPRIAIAAPICVYSGMTLLVALFAVFGYPKMPQSVGGGRHVRVQLLLKDESVGALLRGAPVASGKEKLSDPVDLYFRTQAYLLVRRAQDSPMIQVPMEQVLAVVWLESREN